MSAATPAVGSSVRTWFSDREDGLSTVLAVAPYRGRYGFDWVLRVTAPRTRRGWMELCVSAHNVQESIRCAADPDGAKQEKQMSSVETAQAPSVVIATLETRNFSFEGVGATDIEATLALTTGLIKHAREYKIADDWFNDFRDDIVIRALRCGVAYRDGQQIGGAA